jgi:hypothetical protein
MHYVVCTVSYAFYATTCGNRAVTGWGRGQIKICAGWGLGTKLLPLGRGGENFLLHLSLTSNTSVKLVFLLQDFGLLCN